MTVSVKNHSGNGIRGKKVYGEISGKCFKRESFIAGLAQGNLIATMCFEGTCHTELFNEWLEKLLLPQIGPNKVLVLDNASFHNSRKTRALVEIFGCELLFLPPYSPDLNPIENCWANLKAKIRKFAHKFTNFSQLLDYAILST